MKNWIQKASVAALGGLGLMSVPSVSAAVAIIICGTEACLIIIIR
jgi:hypothetical protein